MPESERATRRVETRLQRTGPHLTRARGAPVVLQGRYRLGHRLGSGASAEVFVATDLRLHRHVAVRVLLPHLASDPRRVDQFQYQVMNLARVDSPNVVAVHDVHLGEANGDHFVVLRHIVGRTLARYMEEHRTLPVERAARIAGELLDAVTALRAQRVFPCALATKDIMIDWDDRPVLIDAGDAPPRGEAAVPPPAHLARIGVLLLYMLTGVEPAGPADGTLWVTLAGVPAPLASVIWRAMARDPSESFESAEAMKRALEAAARESAAAPAPVEGAPVERGGAREAPALSAAGVPRAWSWLLVVHGLLLILWGAVMVWRGP